MESGETTELAALQRRLSRLLTAPEGVADFLAEEGDAEGRSLTGLASDVLLPAVRRLEVYANGYFLRLHDCLKEDYAALSARIGKDGFHDLVTAYLMVHPSRRPSLRFAGAALADFLAVDPAAAPFRKRWPWASDLARFEWALVDAFDAADVRPIRRRDLTDIPPMRWPRLRLRLHPSAQLLRFDWAVDVLRRSWEQRQPSSEAEIARETTICTWRSDENVRFRSLVPAEADLLEAAGDGAVFGRLCARAGKALGAVAAPAFAAECLGRWVDDGLIAGAGWN